MSAYPARSVAIVGCRQRRTSHQIAIGVATASSITANGKSAWRYGMIPSESKSAEKPMPEIG